MSVLTGAGVWEASTGAPSATAANSKASVSATGSVANAHRASASGPPAEAHPATAPSTVAAVFYPNATDHSCSAGVIASSTRDLLITAAHCLNGDGTGMTVVPGYDSGKRPYGTWSVVAVFVDRAWSSTQSEADDFAIMRVAPQIVGGQMQKLQNVTGAVSLGTTPTQPTAMTVQGFNSGHNDRSLACTTLITTNNRGNPTFRCDGYVDGSSGSPWTVYGTNDVERVIGVIGGRDQGGCKAQRSFSSPFGEGVMNLLTRAEGAGLDGDVAPATPPSPACPQVTPPSPSTSS